MGVGSKMVKLKTLKDLAKREHFIAEIVDTNKWGTIPMVSYNGELSAEILRNTYVSLEDIKAEAIKWIQHLDKKAKNQNLTMEERGQMLRDFWMEKFNITSEDLK